METFHLREAPDWGLRGGLHRLCNRLVKSKAKNAPIDCNRETLQRNKIVTNNIPTITVYTHTTYNMQKRSETELCTKPY